MRPSTSLRRHSIGLKVLSVSLREFSFDLRETPVGLRGSQSALFCSYGAINGSRVGMRGSILLFLGRARDLESTLCERERTLSVWLKTPCQNEGALRSPERYLC